MASFRTVATALVAASGVVALCGAALAQTGRSPGQSDFDACNREAQVVRGGSPSPNTSIGSGSVTGSMSGSTGVGSAAGATGGTGSLSGGSTLSGGSSSPTGDVGLGGITSSGSADPGYQQAYRDCLRRRGF